MAQTGQKTVLLHLGAHKTATTSVQHWCQSNAGLLLENGFLYCGHTLRERSAYRILRTACEAARGECAPPDQSAAIAILRKSMQQQLQQPGVKAYLIPWEIYLGEPWRAGSDDFYPGAAAAIAALQAILHGLPVRILYTLRDQWGFLNSWYQQLQKMGRSLEPEPYIAWCSRADLSWQPLIARLRAGFGAANVHVTGYQPEGMVHSLLREYGLPPKITATLPPLRVNRAWPREAMEIAAFTMPKLSAADQAQLRALLDQGFREHPSPAFQVLPPHLRPELDALWNQDQAALLGPVPAPDPLAAAARTGSDPVTAPAPPAPG